jgi:hypothetical protein
LNSGDDSQNPKAFFDSPHGGRVAKLKYYSAAVVVAVEFSTCFSDDYQLRSKHKSPVKWWLS